MNDTGHFMVQVSGKPKLLVTRLLIPFNLELDSHELVLCGCNRQAKNPSIWCEMNGLTSLGIGVTCARCLT